MYHIQFITDYEDINKELFDYDGNLTIKEMLLDFLSKTNSKLTLKINEIYFMYYSKIINSDENKLSKTISILFKNKRINKIRVWECHESQGNIIKSKKYKIRYNTEDEELNEKIFEYDGKLTIKEILYNFLSETNSKLTLNLNEIIFLYKASILNKESNLSKTCFNICKKSKNGLIKVIDRNDVIRGR